MFIAGCLLLDLRKLCSEYSNNQNRGLSEDGGEAQRKHIRATESENFVHQKSISMSTPAANDDSDVLLIFLRRAEALDVDKKSRKSGYMSLVVI